jgi:hypothetical protein
MALFHTRPAVYGGFSGTKSIPFLQPRSVPGSATSKRASEGPGDENPFYFNMHVCPT